MSRKCQGGHKEFIGSSAKARRSMLKHLSLAVTKAHALMPVALVISVF